MLIPDPAHFLSARVPDSDRMKWIPSIQQIPHFVLNSLRFSSLYHPLTVLIIPSYCWERKSI